MPNFKGTRFTNAHETLIWASMGEKARYTFNYRAMKTLNDELQMRSDWEFPICGGQERLKKGGSKVHPTQKPEALLYRILLACDEPGRRGARSLFRHRHDRRGGEAPRPPLDRHRARGHDYMRRRDRADRSRAAARRIALKTMHGPQRPRRASRSARWSRTADPAPGDGADRHQAPLDRAMVRADGSLDCGDAVGSIHKLGAALQGAPSCNGWTFWHYEGTDGLKPIDDLRQTYLLATQP
jgi:modification methylase